LDLEWQTADGAIPQNSQGDGAQPARKWVRKRAPTCGLMFYSSMSFHGLRASFRMRLRHWTRFDTSRKSPARRS